MAMHTNRTENACVGKGRRKKSNRALVGYTGEPMNRLPETSVHQPIQIHLPILCI